MRTEKDVESYLLGLKRRFEPAVGPHGNVDKGTYLIHSSDAMPSIALRVDPPLVVLRVHIGDAPRKDETALFRKLLELNAKALVHASYGLEDNRIVLSAALPLENLDFNELQMALDEIDVALAQQVPVLADLHKKQQ